MTNKAPETEAPVMTAIKPKPRKAKAKASKKAAARREPLSLAARIKLLTKENPKRPGSKAARTGSYFSASPARYV